MSVDVYQCGRCGRTLVDMGGDDGWCDCGQTSDSIVSIIQRHLEAAKIETDNLMSFGEGVSHNNRSRAVTLLRQIKSAMELVSTIKETLKSARHNEQETKPPYQAEQRTGQGDQIKPHRRTVPSGQGYKQSP